MDMRQPIKRRSTKPVKVDKIKEIPIFGEDGLFPYEAIEEKLKNVNFPVKNLKEVFLDSDIRVLHSRNSEVKAINLLKQITELTRDALMKDFPIQNLENFMKKLKERNPKIKIRIRGEGRL